jgi:hypothetical protein
MQIVAPAAAPRQEVSQQPSRRLQQTEPPVIQQRQLEPPPTRSEASSGTGQELVIQGREVARKASGKR